jgi:hypothetical protein
VITSPDVVNSRQCRSGGGLSSMFPRYIVHEGYVSVEAVDGSKGVVDHAWCLLLSPLTVKASLRGPPVAQESTRGEILPHDYIKPS